MRGLAPSAWTRLRAAVDPFTRRAFRLYTAYPLSPAEYLTTCDYALLRDELKAARYEPARLSAAKRHPDTDSLHVVSVRRQPDHHPPDVAATALERYDPRRCQYHLHAFTTPVTAHVDVFMHYELAPDLWPLESESWPEAIARMEEHYRPQYDFGHVNREEWTYLRGLEDPALSLY